MSSYNSSHLEGGSMRIIAACLILFLALNPSVEAQNSSDLIIEVEGLHERIQKLPADGAEKQILRELASTQLSILQRIRNLEDAYKIVQDLIASFNKVISIVKETLNIPDIILNPSKQTEIWTRFEHISGVIMEPGAVGFTVSTRDARSFEELGMDAIEMDVYFNQNIFNIDHIWGKKVKGELYKQISLPADSRSFKDRISLPISDVLANQVSFYIFLAPIDPLKISIGDSSSIDIRYYKRTEKLDGVEVPPPVLYQRMLNSPDHISVTVI